MRRQKRKISGLALVLMMFGMVAGLFIISTPAKVYASSKPTILYNAHSQDIGWQGWRSEGVTAGTTGQSRRMEAVCIKLSKNNTSMITYRAHVQDLGWLNWVESGQVAGTTGKSYRLEGIQIKLKNEYASQYDIYYRMHVSDFGWLGWAKNGELAGSEGIGLAAEAIEIRLVRKGDTFNTGGQAAYRRPKLSYRAHCADIGWMNTVTEAKTAGTTGRSRRMEALNIYLKDFTNKNGVLYRAHVSNIGWQDWKSSGKMMGTTGQSRQMEAVEIKLSNSLSAYFDIYYRVHVSNVGWLGWAKNGETAGSTGQSLAIEAIEIKLVNKGNRVDVGGSAVYKGQSGFQMPLANARCSWSSSNNWSWGENKYGGGYSSARVYHLAVDLLGSSDDVYSTADGTVVKSGWNDANGNYVVIKHNLPERSIYSFYAHLSSRTVSEGTMVSKGQKIGVVGNTGNIDGKHLHFAITDTLRNGDYYGYSTYFTGNSCKYRDVTYYNPVYVINNGKLP